eukprot:2238084-Rhodomonas_salina.3
MSGRQRVTTPRVGHATPRDDSSHEPSSGFSPAKSHSAFRPFVGSSTPRGERAADPSPTAPSSQVLLAVRVT